ncbi:unnamed protein product [Timema podura]|uniref:Uncharacterized protein n=1 Tax=Timema podura TaxID=61482 RepID=A0ABN7NXJ0_TIMPD|nr:unnamed protein product [Timema podura]
MSPLGFDAKKLFKFISLRFKKTSAKVQEQALHWLQILTMLEIVFPLHLLFSMFGDGVKVMKTLPKEPVQLEKPIKKEEGVRKSSISPVVEDDSGNTSPLSDDELPTSRHVEFETDVEMNLSCCILMLDVLLQQMELQEVERNNGVQTSLAQDVCRLLKCMLGASWVGTHTCTSKVECVFCESCVMWHQLALELMEYLMPENPVNPPDSQAEEQSEESGHGRKSPPESEKKSEPKPDVIINMPIPEIHSVGGVLAHMPHVVATLLSSVEQTSVLETVSEGYLFLLSPVLPTPL